MRNIIPYKPHLKELARKLRNDSTKSEVILWDILKNRQFQGYKFIRQKPLLDYIVDFYCYELDLVIELDGYSHQHIEVIVNDEKREGILGDYGLHILRFDDEEVFNNIDNVLRALEKYIFEFEKDSDK